MIGFPAKALADCLFNLRYGPTECPSLQKVLVATVTENSIETDLRLGVEAKGGMCLKWVSPGRRGVPDRIVVTRRGNTIYVETKAPGGRLESWQERCHAELRKRKCRVEVIWTPEQVNGFLCSL